MSNNYDNWERLLTVVLRREWDNYLALCSSSDDPTDSSDGCSSSSQFTGHRPSCSCYECHNTSQGVPDPMLPTSSYSQKYSNASNDRVDYPGSSGAPGKFRLVRCPKCGGILLELTEYSVYQCGGCGAVLKAAEEDTGSFKDSTSANKPSSKEVVKGAPPSSDSSLLDHFEYSNKFHAAVKSGGEGNRTGRSEQHDKVLPNKANNNRQIVREESSATETNLSSNKANNNPQIVREVSSATEIDLSSNEYNNTGTTFDSGEPSREGDRMRGSRLAASLFDGYQGSSRSGESVGQESGSVTVNGHLISDRLIKKAEKLAGPILPGHYWYDFRAGFWGAIGGPCLGIIPPFIEEFNFPMPEHCAGGNTGVFINGRELDQKDLTLLGNRGLPMQPDRSYIVEISGRVIDEDTHEELNSLGKLAPTVERLKHGFGMRATRAA